MHILRLFSWKINQQDLCKTEVSLLSLFLMKPLQSWFEKSLKKDFHTVEKNQFEFFDFVV